MRTRMSNDSLQEVPAGFCGEHVGGVRRSLSNNY